MPIRNPTSAVIPSACAPVRYKLAEISRHGIRCGCPTRYNASSNNWPDKISKPSRCSHSKKAPFPRTLTGHSQSRVGGGGPGGVCRRSSSLSCSGRSSKCAGRRSPHARHSSTAPASSICAISVISHCSSGSAAYPASSADSDRMRPPSEVNVQRPESTRRGAPSSPVSRRNTIGLVSGPPA